MTSDRAAGRYLGISEFRVDRWPFLDLATKQLHNDLRLAVWLWKTHIEAESPMDLEYR